MLYGDLCSGISCPAFALRQLGVDFKYVFACDTDKRCKKFLTENHHPEIIYDDIRSIDILPYVDLLVSGFCCQPFSAVNTYNKLENHNSFDLWEHVIRLIKTCQPKIFMMENVRGIGFKSNKLIFDKIIESMHTIGDYHISYKLLNSKDYGIPQSRNRYWFIGSKNEWIWPSPIPLMYTLNDVLDLSLPMVKMVTRSKNGYPLNISNGEFWISNNQSTGRFNVYYLLPRDVSYCILTIAFKTILHKKDDILYWRSYTIDELKLLFGLTTDIVGDWNTTAMHKFLGNGMDVHMLMLLLKPNI